MGVKGDLLALIEYSLFERQQRVVLNGQGSEWLTIKAGVPQGSILDPLFFIYINHLSNVNLFADDTSMFSIVHDPIKLVFGPMNGKCPSIQIHLNKLKR